MSYEVIIDEGVPIKAWVRGVLFEDEAHKQLLNVSKLGCVFHHIAVMPDVHWGMGATVGSVIPTKGAIIPAAVGVDIGCGMIAQKTNLTSKDLGDNAQKIFDALQWIPVGGPGEVGSWRDDNIPKTVLDVWLTLNNEYAALCSDYPIEHRAPHRQLGTLGTGNHFIEVCLDESDCVWLMLHSGSRGPGNRIGVTFIELARKDMEKWFIHLPDRDLAYLPEGTEHFAGYVKSVHWAQRYASLNRQLMMAFALAQIAHVLPHLTFDEEQAVNCHHNYVQKENHFGSNVWLTRKGAVSARLGELGIIPGSMGVRSYIGNPESFNSCSHGAGRSMSRGKAKKSITLEQHIAATEGVVCRKDAGVIDESPAAYKDIEAVIAAESDLVEVVHTLKQVVCVKG